LTALFFYIIIFVASYLSGLLGALTGLGGGGILVPLLVLFFHVNIYYAMGASLISAMAMSTVTSATYLRQGYTNIRIGMFLEIGAVIGALAGAVIVAFLSISAISFIFGIMLFISAYLSLRRREDEEQSTSSHSWAIKLRLASAYPVYGEHKVYTVQHPPLALLVMGISGALSGLLGIGGGIMKVLAMDHVMRLPYKVSTTTSNFMIGITAAVSAGIYLSRGYINPSVTVPVMLGIIAGSFHGTRLLSRVHQRILRMVFSAVVCVLGAQMIYKALISI